MDWLQSLLWDPSSVAHIVFLYAFVVAAGVYLGKIKIFGVSLGVTFVLFAGILMGHFGFTADTHILHFIREFGLILFVFCIGLQVGPSFFSSFKKGGMTLNLLAVGIVVLNIAVALGLYYLWNGRVELPMTADCTGLCLCVSAGCGRYHRFYHSYPLHLPRQYDQRGREPENSERRRAPQAAHDEP